MPENVLHEPNTGIQKGDGDMVAPGSKRRVEKAACHSDILDEEGRGEGNWSALASPATCRVAISPAFIANDMREGSSLPATGLESGWTPRVGHCLLKATTR